VAGENNRIRRILGVECTESHRSVLKKENVKIMDICLGAFAKIAKSNYQLRNIFCLSVRPSVPIKQLVSQWADFHEI